MLIFFNWKALCLKKIVLNFPSNKHGIYLNLSLRSVINEKHSESTFRNYLNEQVAVL